MHRRLRILRALRGLMLLGVVALGLPAAAAVYNIHLHTGSTPDFVDRESFLATATGPWHEPEDQALAIFRWMHRTHRQTHHTREDGRALWDPMMFYNSYANTFCGYMAGYLTTFMDGMGGDWQHRYWELGDHTVAEVSWDAGANWHLLDTSMMTYAIDPADGEIASIAEIETTGQSELMQLLGAAPEAGYIYTYHTANTCMSNPSSPDHVGDLGYPSGYRRASGRPVAYARTLRNGADSYLNSNALVDSYSHVRTGWRHRLHLEPGQTYTRHWRRLADDVDHYRPTSGGQDPHDTSPEAGYHGTGVWDWTIDLGSTSYRDVMHVEDGLVHASEAGGGFPRLRTDGVGSGSVSFKVDAANVTTSADVDLSGDCPAGDTVALEFSRDAGVNWTTAWTAPGGAFDTTVHLDAADVGGAHEYLVRVNLDESGGDPCGLDALSITTITQVNSFVLPRLERGANKVMFSLGDQLEAITLWPTLVRDGAQRYQDSAESWSGLTARNSHDDLNRSVLMGTSADVEGHATWLLTAPTDIARVTYGGSFLARHQTANDRVELLHAFDGGAFHSDAVFDGSGASGFDDRVYATVVAPAGAREARLRYAISSSIDAAWDGTGVHTALMTVEHEPRVAGPDPVAVTFAWTEHRHEGDVPRAHTFVVDGDDEWVINVAGYRDPTMTSLTLKLADGPEIVGYADGVDVGPGHGRDKVRIDFDWRDALLAHERPYTVSRAADPANPDDGGELTDGTIIPPTPYDDIYWAQNQVAYWSGDAPVEVTVDLGSARTFAAARVTTHQPNADWCHAGTIDVAVSDDGTTFQSVGVIQHDDIWNPAGDHLDWGFVQSPRYDDLPAQGRLSHPFWLLLDTPASGRWVRFTFVPLAGRGVGISELQLLSAVEVSDWPDRDIATSVEPHDPDDDDVPTPRRARLRVWPNPGNPAFHVRYELPVAGPVRLTLHDLRGRRVRTLAEGWRAAGAHDARWDGRDDDGRALPSGTYVVNLDRDGATTSGSVVLLR